MWTPDRFASPDHGVFCEGLFTNTLSAKYDRDKKGHFIYTSVSVMVKYR